jgi:hypothetical protein
MATGVMKMIRRSPDISFIPAAATREAKRSLKKHAIGPIGCPNLGQLGPDFLWRADWMQNR